MKRQNLRNSVSQRAKARGIKLEGYEKEFANSMEDRLFGTYTWLTDEAREGIIAREILRCSAAYPAIREIGEVNLFEKMKKLFALGE